LAKQSRRAGRGGAWRAVVALGIIGLVLGGGVFACDVSARALAPGRIGTPAASLSVLERMALGGYLALRGGQLAQPSPRAQGGSLTVLEGENGSTLAARLAGEGWIADGAVFRTYLRYTGGDRSLYPGTYGVPPGLSTRGLADLIVSGRTRQVELTIFAGWRVEEIAAALQKHGLSIAAGDFIAATHRRPGNLALYLAVPAAAGLEGFLLPGQYLIEQNANADLLVFELTNGFEHALTDDFRQSIAARGLTLYQAVTLASIIEREAMHADEMPLIASVFLNRLATGMRLEADPTVQYALGYSSNQDTWWRSPLSESDLQIDSPYNTYLYAGLPPSPISNPSAEALRAVAAAPSTSYLFFRAACDGSGRHQFSETYEQHVANACP
jgi:peptidoglycan lytic transglycosylase G